MPDNSIIFLIFITLLFIGILVALHHAAKKRESLLREQLGNLGLLLDEERSTLHNRIKELEGQIYTKAQILLDEWRTRDVGQIREELKSIATQEAKMNLEQWIFEHTLDIREDTQKRSRAVIAGQVAERFTPFMPSIFQYNPKDARFIGSPIDLIVFDGADEDDVRRIIFLEVKTGNSSLSTRQKQIKKIIENLGSQIVMWEQTRIPDKL
jgi:predicted Holliday junction resolvase-like endonuclease